MSGTEAPHVPVARLARVALPRLAEGLLLPVSVFYATLLAGGHWDDAAWAVFATAVVSSAVHLAFKQRPNLVLLLSVVGLTGQTLLGELLHDAWLYWVVAQSGVASGVLNMTRGMGTAMGLAFTSLVFGLVAGSEHAPESLVTRGFEGSAGFLGIVAVAAMILAALRGKTALSLDPAASAD